MRKLLLFIALVFLGHALHAQFIKEKSINAQIGYGISAPYDSLDEIADDGFFAQGEFILTARTWIDFRPYIGLILTSSNGEDLNGNPTEEKAETKAALLGAKTRIKAPIPYVAPYLEIGIGTSIGSFNTDSFFYNYKKSGFIYHIPLSIGLELGKSHNIDLGLSYYFQPSIKQFAGAFSLGVTIPLKN